VYHEEERTARRTHWCCECGGRIAPGERYQAASGVWEGGLGAATQHTCRFCAELRLIYVSDHEAGFQDDPPCFGELMELVHSLPEDVCKRLYDEAKQAVKAKG